MAEDSENWMTSADIIRLRRLAGLTVRGACEACGLSPASARKWRRWETGAELMPMAVGDRLRQAVADLTGTG